MTNFQIVDIEAAVLNLTIFAICRWMTNFTIIDIEATTCMTNFTNTFMKAAYMND